MVWNCPVPWLSLRSCTGALWGRNSPQGGAYTSLSVNRWGVMDTANALWEWLPCHCAQGQAAHLQNKHQVRFCFLIHSVMLLGFQLLDLIILCTLRDNFPEPMNTQFSQWFYLPFILNKSGRWQPMLSTHCTFWQTLNISMTLNRDRNEYFVWKWRGLPGTQKVKFFPWERLSQHSHHDEWSPEAQ